MPFSLILTIVYTVVNIASGFVENIWIINSNALFRKKCLDSFVFFFAFRKNEEANPLHIGGTTQANPKYVVVNSFRCDEQSSLFLHVRRPIHPLQKRNSLLSVSVPVRPHQRHVCVRRKLLHHKLREHHQFA